MLRTDVQVQSNKNAGKAVRDGTERAMLDAGQAGLNRALSEVPHGATSGLAQSAFGPDVADDGSVIWGFAAEYAEHVEFGTRPHFPPVDALKRWARRVLGDEGAAWPVAKKIAEKGTPAQPYVRPGIDATKAFLRQTGLKAYIEEEL